MQQLYNLYILYAFQGKWEHAYRILYYEYSSGRPNIIDYSSPERYEMLKRRQLELAAKDLQNNYDECRGYYWYLSVHDLDTYINKGVPVCFSYRPAYWGILYNYYINPEDPSEASRAFEGALVLLNLGLYDRARQYIDILRNFSKMPYRRGRGYHPQHYRSSLDFLEALCQARTSQDPDEARRYAARAIAANFRMVVDCFHSDDAAGSFHADNASLALCVAVEFEFDMDWSKTCCHAMLFLLSGCQFHMVFKKAIEWDAWMWPPEKFDLLPLEKVREIASKAPMRR